MTGNARTWTAVLAPLYFVELDLDLEQLNIQNCVVC